MATNYPSIDPTCNTHTDPGVYWKWDHYMSLISEQDLEVIHGFEFVTFTLVGSKYFRINLWNKFKFDF